MTSVLGGTPFVANAFTSTSTPVASGSSGTGLLPIGLPILVAVIGATLVTFRSRRAAPKATR
ncbi:MAG: hypothetical protein KGI38_11220 [Thaumarchaeota archaeon]|nr:hypothetical protein [Nitrososphaerota archaeon]